MSPEGATTLGRIGGGWRQARTAWTKLGLRDRAAAIVYAFDTGLASPGA
jgi:hypothetical protein